MTRHDGAPVLWTLVQVAHLARRRLSETIDQEGVSGPQFGVLAALLDGDDLTSSDLARALLVRPQSMSGLVEALTGKGLVERRGPGGRGQRTVVALTAEGRGTAQRVRRRLSGLDEARVIGLGPGDVTGLVDLLDQVRHALEAGEVDDGD